MERKKEKHPYGRKRSTLHAGYTVEASVIMAIIIWVLTGLLVCTFYLHDRAVLQGMVCESASAGSNTATGKERQSIISRQKQQITEGRLLGSRQLTKRVSGGAEEVSAEASGSYPVPGAVVKYFSGGELRIWTFWISSRVMPSEQIRKLRGLRRLRALLVTE